MKSKNLLMYGSVALSMFCMTTFTSCDDDDNDDNQSGSTYDCVDLGLESGTKWATYNIGATKVTESGKFYSYGDINEYVQKSLGIDSVLYVDCGSIDTMSSVNRKKYDVAMATWGDNWQVPNKTQCEELVNGCTWEFTDNYQNSNVSGYVGTSKKNGKQIFFPGVGYRITQGVDPNFYDSKASVYLSSSLADENSANVIYMGEVEDMTGDSTMAVESVSTWGREFGYTVRAVKK